jgi:uncharacterized protein (TIGR03435 family)
MFRTLAIVLLALATALGQSTNPPPSFDGVEIRPSSPVDHWMSIGLLPDGHVQCHYATLRMLVAAAYDRNEDLVTGGPAWLDTERFDLIATAGPTSKDNLRLMLQTLLGQRFKLALKHTGKTEPVFALTVRKGGPKLQRSASSEKTCPQASGPPSQLHFACRGYTITDLADLLPEIAPAYMTLPVLDQTNLNGAYDFNLDWMGKGAYEAAIANQAAGVPKDPLAVSIFDAIASLGLSLEKHEIAKDTIIVDSAERVPATSTGGAAATISSVPALPPAQLATVDHYVTGEMEREHIPGLAVGIYSRGQILLAKGYGLANVELQVPVKPDTIFQSGSVGKQFVSAAVMMLVEEGKVGLDDSIVRYFPDAPESWKPILVKNLLSHTSGLAEYESPERTGPKGPFYMRLDFTEDELMSKIEALPIEFKPGEKWDYRNTNYVLLGVMIHKVTGKFYADFLQERIFKPWDMRATRLISETEIIPNRSSGYEMHGSTLRNQEWVSPTFNSTGDGTLYFNVLDLAKWDEALYSTSLLKQSSLDRIWTVFLLNDGKPNPAQYGFGWGMHAVNGHKVIEHGGAWQGFTCNISRFVDDGLTVVVLTNLAGARPGVIAHTVAGLVNPVLEPPPPKEHKEITVNPKLFDGYIGKYQLAPDFILTITRHGDHLFGQATGQGMLELFPEGERDFFLKVVDAQITFVTDTSGRASELILHQGGDQPAKRIE